MTPPQRGRARSGYAAPRTTDFDLFVTQLPNAPFGVAW